MGVKALQELIDREIDLCGVIARWDDPSPGQWYPSVADLASECKLPLFKPKDINDPEFVAQMKALAPDLMFTAFYPKIYKRALLEIPPHGSFNLHFAPLPRYRGSFPGAWAIINGETHHGVTIHQMAAGVDNGDIVAQVKVPIDPADTGKDLYEKCEEYGLQLFRQTLPALLDRSYTLTPQDPGQALYYDRNYPYGGVVNFAWTTTQVIDYIRACTFPPFPNPDAYVNGKKFTLLKVQPSSMVFDSGDPPGKIRVIDGRIHIRTADGAVEVLAMLNNMGKAISLKEFDKYYNISHHACVGR